MCHEFCPRGGGCYPSKHCRWYPNMPCRFPGPHPRGKFRGIWQGGCLLQGGEVSALGGCLLLCLVWGGCLLGGCGDTFILLPLPLRFFEILGSDFGTSVSSSCYSELQVKPHGASASALMPVMAYVDLYLDNKHQASAFLLLSSIETSVNADSNADARCGQGLTAHACV